MPEQEDVPAAMLSVMSGEQMITPGRVGPIIGTTIVPDPFMRARSRDGSGRFS
jgi:hypothetical protein